MRQAPPPLRLGLLVDSLRVQAWLAPALEDAQRRGLAQITLIVERTADPPLAGLARLRRYWAERHYVLYDLFCRVDAARSPAPANPDGVDLRTLAPEALHILVDPVRGVHTDTVAPSDVARIREAGADVLLRVGFRILHGEILSAAPHGVLSYHHGDPRAYRGGPPGFWEVMEDAPTSSIIIQRLTEELDGGHVLAHAVHPTLPISPIRNLEALHANSARMLGPVLERLHRSDAELPAASRTCRGWIGYDRPLYRRPDNGAMLRAIPRLAGRYLGRRLQAEAGEEQWHLAWHWSPAETHGVPHGSFRRYRIMTPPRDRYWADPFIATEGGRHWVFFEELRFRHPRGTIAACEITADGPVGSPRTVLERPWHLSYPGVFKHDGQWYLLPESGESGQVELFEAVEFPFAWQRSATLLEGCVADPTLFRYEDAWYLFGSPYRPGESPMSELHLFVADSLHGPYRPHPLNPLITDARHARMAGQLFRAGGDLLRPAQVCVPTYGSAISIRRVLELSPTRFAEEPVQEITPRWDPALEGLHTMNAAGHLSMIDLLRRTPR